jgi:putative hydrolase of the HAD superfamily
MKAVGFDLIGTLCRAGVREDDCLHELFLYLVRNGIDVSFQDFVGEYNHVALKYLTTRKNTLREVNNRVWISETLRAFRFNIDEDDEIVRNAADAYFRPYISNINVPTYVAPILQDIRGNFKTGLITNFTYAPAVRQILERNNLTNLFDSIAISDEVGWRKPHPNIFQKFLHDVSVKPSETFYVGDDPRYDVAGAKTVGMKAILLRSDDTRFSETYYGALDEECSKPDIHLKSLQEFREYLLTEI